MSIADLRRAKVEPKLERPLERKTMIEEQPRQPSLPGGSPEVGQWTDAGAHAEDILRRVSTGPIPSDPRAAYQHLQHLELEAKKELFRDMRGITSLSSSHEQYTHGIETLRELMRRIAKL
jgi:hypothetical protein